MLIAYFQVACKHDIVNTDSFVSWIQLIDIIYGIDKEGFVDHSDLEEEFNCSLLAVRIAGTSYFSPDDIYGVISIGVGLLRAGRMGNWNEQIRSNGPTILQSGLDFLQNEDFRRSDKKKEEKRKHKNREKSSPSWRKPSGRY